MNKVILIGRLTKDPELRNTPTGVPVVQFTLAVNRSYQSADGQSQADFINCIAWRAQAENLARFMKQGGQVAVEGSIQTRTYDDQNGVRRYVTEVVCQQITFLGAKRDNSNGNGYGDLSQLTPPQQPQYNRNNNNYGYNNNNYSNNNYNNYNRPSNNDSLNQDSFEETKSPFTDIDVNIDDNDLPF